MLAELTALLSALTDIGIVALGLAAAWWALDANRKGNTDAARYWLAIALLALIAARAS